MSVSAPWVAMSRFGDQAENRASDARMRTAITVKPRRSQKFTGKPVAPFRYFPRDICKRNLEYIQRVAGRGCMLTDAVPEDGWGLTSSGRTKIRFSGGAVVHTLSGMGISNLAALQIFNGIFASYRLLLGTEFPLGGSPPPSMRPGLQYGSRPGRQIVQVTEATANTTSRICPFALRVGPMAARTDRRIRLRCRVRRGGGIGDEEPNR